MTAPKGGRQAIVAYPLSPTNYKPARVKATCNAGSVTLNWDHEISDEDNHWRAATALVVKLGWVRPAFPGDWRMGWLPKQGGAVFVYT